MSQLLVLGGPAPGVRLPYVLLALLFFFFNDTATTEIYTLSLHDALPIYGRHDGDEPREERDGKLDAHRSEEHTSELQSHSHLVCRLLLEKKNKLPPQQTTDIALAAPSILETATLR